MRYPNEPTCTCHQGPRSHRLAPQPSVLGAVLGWTLIALATVLLLPVLLIERLFAGRRK
jgi:hypothetical protein